MKKLMNIMILINIIFAIIISIWQFSFVNEYNLFNGKSEIQIEKPTEMSNLEYLSCLERIMKRLGTDICYVTYNFVAEKNTIEVYTTRNNSDFLNLWLEKGDYRSEVYSSNFGSGVKKIYGCDLLKEITVRELLNAQSLSLEKLIFYVETEKQTIIMKELEKENIVSNNFSYEDSNNKIENLNSIEIIRYILLFFLSVSILFRIIEKTKKIAIYKLNGYSVFKIIFKDIKEFKFGIILITCMCVCVVLVIFIERGWQSSTLYIMTQYIKYINIITICFISYIISVAYIYCCDLVACINNRNKNSELYVIITAAKFAIVLLLVLNLSGVVNTFMLLDELNTGNMKINTEIKDYVHTTLRDPEYKLFDQSEEEVFRENCRRFLRATEKKFKGIILSLDGYYIPKGNENRSNESRNIVINSNFLDINPVYLASGKQITSELFKAGKINVLICQGEDKKRVVNDALDMFNFSENEYGTGRAFSKKDINLIVYSKESRIHAINPYSGMDFKGALKNPIIYIYDENLSYFNDIEVIISNGAYMLKCGDNVSQNEIHSLLKKFHLDYYIQELPEIRNTFSDEINNVYKKLLINMGTIFICMIPMMFILIYTSLLYCENNIKKIFVKRINGQGFFKCHIFPFTVELAMWIIMFFLLHILKIENIMSVCLCIINFGGLFFSIFHFEKININEVLKGSK